VPQTDSHVFTYANAFGYNTILSLSSSGASLGVGSIRLNPSELGTKLIYYTDEFDANFLTEIQTNILRHLIPTGNSYVFRIGSTDIMTISSSGITGSGFSNFALLNASNTFTQTNTFKTITFTNTTTERQITLFRQIDANAFTHYGFNVEVLGGGVGTLRYHAPNGTQHLFSLSNAGNTAYTNILSISNTEINVNASNSTSGSPRLVFWKHPGSSNRDSYIVRSGVNMIYSTGEIGTSSYHTFQIGIPAATTVCSIGDIGVSLARGNFNMNVGDIRFPATATTKIQYYGAGGGYSTEVAAGILRQISPSQHIWKIGSVDTLTLSATALDRKSVV